jgi:hypothetical protein
MNLKKENLFKIQFFKAYIRAFGADSNCLANQAKRRKVCRAPEARTRIRMAFWQKNTISKNSKLFFIKKDFLQNKDESALFFENSSFRKIKRKLANREFLLINKYKIDMQLSNSKDKANTFYNYTFDKGRLKSLVSWSLKTYGEYKTIKLLENLKRTGFEYATKAGISLGIEDLKIPPKKALLLYEAEEISKKAIDQYNRSEITGVERFQRLIDTWHRTSEQLKQEVIDYFENTDILNPVYMMAFSGARGNISQVRQLVGMRGLMADPKGQIIDYPIRSNFREGLTLTEYIISSYGARKGIVDTALRTANAGYLTRRLVDVAQHVVISHFDCGTSKGIFLNDMKEGNKTIYSLQTRLIGRVLARNIVLGKVETENTRTRTEGAQGAQGAQYAESQKKISNLLQYVPEALQSSKTNTLQTAKKDNKKIVYRNQEITSDLAFEITKYYKKVFVRSPLTCGTDGVTTKKVICQLCYGWSLAQGTLVSIGEAIGIVAAQSIGEPGTQLTMRTFHTGGVFSGDISDQIRAPYNGYIHYSAIESDFVPSAQIDFENPKAFLKESSSKIAGTLIRTPEGQMAFLTKTDGFVCVYNNSNPIDRSKKWKIPAYTILYYQKGQQVFEKQVIAQISTIARQQNMRDDSEFTVKSEIQGQLFIKTLQIEEQFIGPKQKKNSSETDDSGTQQTNPLVTAPPAHNQKLSSWDWGYAWVLSCKLYKIPILSSEGTKKIALIPQKGDFVDTNSIMTQIQWFLPQHGGYSIFLQKNPVPVKAFSVSQQSYIGTHTRTLSTFGAGAQCAGADLKHFLSGGLSKTFTNLLKNSNKLFNNNLTINKNLLYLDINKIYYKKIGYFLDNENFFIFLPKNIKGINKTFENQTLKELDIQAEGAYIYDQPRLQNKAKNSFGIQFFSKRPTMFELAPELFVEKNIFFSKKYNVVKTNKNFSKLYFDLNTQAKALFDFFSTKDAQFKGVFIAKGNKRNHNKNNGFILSGQRQNKNKGKQKVVRHVKSKLSVISSFQRKFFTKSFVSVIKGRYVSLETQKKPPKIQKIGKKHKIVRIRAEGADLNSKSNIVKTSFINNILEIAKFKNYFLFSSLEKQKSYAPEFGFEKNSYIRAGGADSFRKIKRKQVSSKINKSRLGSKIPNRTYALSRITRTLSTFGAGAQGESAYNSKPAGNFNLLKENIKNQTNLRKAVLESGLNEQLKKYRGQKSKALWPKAMQITKIINGDKNIGQDKKVLYEPTNNKYIQKKRGQHSKAYNILLLPSRVQTIQKIKNNMQNFSKPEATYAPEARTYKILSQFQRKNVIVFKSQGPFARSNNFSKKDFFRALEQKASKLINQTNLIKQITQANVAFGTQRNITSKSDKIVFNEMCYAPESFFENKDSFRKTKRVKSLYKTIQNYLNLKIFVSEKLKNLLPIVVLSLPTQNSFKTMSQFVTNARNLSENRTFLNGNYTNQVNSFKTSSYTSQTSSKQNNPHPWIFKTFNILNAINLDKKILSFTKPILENSGDFEERFLKKTNQTSRKSGCLSKLSFSNTSRLWFLPNVKSSKEIPPKEQVLNNNNNKTNLNKSSEFYKKSFILWPPAVKKPDFNPKKWYINPKPRFLPSEIEPISLPKEILDQNKNTFINNLDLNSKQNGFKIQPNFLSPYKIDLNKIKFDGTQGSNLTSDNTKQKNKLFQKALTITVTPIKRSLSRLFKKTRLNIKLNSVSPKAPQISPEARMIHAFAHGPKAYTNLLKVAFRKARTLSNPKQNPQLTLAVCTRNIKAVYKYYAPPARTITKDAPCIKQKTFFRYADVDNFKKKIPTTIFYKKNNLGFYLNKKLTYFLASKFNTIKTAKKITKIKNNYLIRTNNLSFHKMGTKVLRSSNFFKTYKSFFLNKQKTSLNPLSKIPNATFINLPNQTFENNLLKKRQYAPEAEIQTQSNGYGKSVIYKGQFKTKLAISKYFPAGGDFIKNSAVGTVNFDTFILTFSMPYLFYNPILDAAEAQSSPISTNLIYIKHPQNFKNVNINLTHLNNSTLLFESLKLKKVTDQADLTKNLVYPILSNLTVNNSIWKRKTTLAKRFLMFNSNFTQTLDNLETPLAVKKRVVFNTFGVYSHDLNSPVAHKVWSKVYKTSYVPEARTISHLFKNKKSDQTHFENLQTRNAKVISGGQNPPIPILSLKTILLGLFKQVCFEFNLTIKVKNYKFGLNHNNLKEVISEPISNWFLGSPALKKPFESIVGKASSTFQVQTRKSYYKESLITGLYLYSPSDNLNKKFKTNVKISFDNVNYALTALASTSFLSSYNGEILNLGIQVGPPVRTLKKSLTLRNTKDISKKISFEKSLKVFKYKKPNSKTFLNNQNRCFLLTKKDFSSYKIDYYTETKTLLHMFRTNTGPGPFARTFHKKSVAPEARNLKKLNSLLFNANCLVKTSPTKDTNLLFDNRKTSNSKVLKIGSFVLRGTKADFQNQMALRVLNPKLESAPEALKVFNLPGQIIHWNLNKVTVRKAQPFFVSAKTTFHAFHGDFVQSKEPVITLIYQKLKTGDIIQGIPKVEQFFEARTTKRGRLFRDNLPNLLKGLFLKYYFYYFKRLKDGFWDSNSQFQQPTERRTKPITLDYSYMAAQWSVKQSFYKIQQIAVDGVLRVYRSQGVTISDKHLEIVVKQMTTKVRIIKSGQTSFFPGEIVDLDFIETLNAVLIRKIHYEPIILGITKASLQVDSFLSSASFQQTSKILSEAALINKKDYLKGIKENVILGNLIPAGTGYLISTHTQRN